MSEKEDGLSRWTFEYKPGQLTEAQEGALRALSPIAPKWFCWGSKWPDREGKPKAPGNPKNLKRGCPNDMQTAGALEVALERLNWEGVAGVGLALKAADPDIVILDFDHVRNPDTGNLHDIGREALQRFEGHYVETSPSGSGLRAVVRYSGHDLEGKTAISMDVTGPDGQKIKIELFRGGHNSYTRMTGELVPGYGVAQVGEGGEVVEWIKSLKPTGAAQQIKANSASPGGAVWDKLAHYRGDEEDPHPDKVSEAVKRKAQRGAPLAQALSRLRDGKEDSDDDFKLACEAVRSGAGNADDVGEVLLMLADGKARKKLRDREDYRRSTAGNAAATVLQSIEQNDLRAFSRSTWKNLPAALRRKENAHAPEGLKLSETEREALAALEASGLRFHFSAGGKLTTNPANGSIALQACDTTLGALRFNVWTQDVECVRPLRDMHPHALGQPGKLRDVDYSFIGGHLLRRWGLNLKIEQVREAVSMAAHALEVDPPKDALERLPRWDGVPRLGAATEDGPGWLVTYAKVKNEGAEDYVRAVGCCFMVAAVKRIMEPGCKMDELLCLEGKGGGGKSTLFRVLADALLPGSFTDQVHDFSDNKHRVEMLEGKLFAELGELAAVRKASDVEALKAALSATADEARRAYARGKVTIQRRYVVAGTTNRERYLNDPTGALTRRFWCVYTTSSEADPIDMEAFKRDAPQLWAEALHQYRNGHRTYISKGTPAFSQWQRERAQREEEQPFTEEVRVAINKIANARGAYDPRKGITAANLASLGGIDADNWAASPALQKQFTNAMKNAGITKGRIHGGYQYWIIQRQTLDAEAGL